MRTITTAATLLLLTQTPAISAPVVTSVRVELAATLAEVNGIVAVARPGLTPRTLTPSQIDDSLETGAFFLAAWSLSAAELAYLRGQGLTEVTLCTHEAGGGEDGDPCRFGLDRARGEAMVDLYPDDGPFNFGRAGGGAEYARAATGPVVDLATGAVTRRFSYAAHHARVLYDAERDVLATLYGEPGSVLGEFGAESGVFTYSVPVFVRVGENARLDHTDEIVARWTALWTEDIVTAPAPGGLALFGLAGFAFAVRRARA